MIGNIRHSVRWATLFSVSIHTALAVALLWPNEPLIVDNQTTQILSAKLVKVSGDDAGRSSTQPQAKVTTATNGKAPPKPISVDKTTKAIVATQPKSATNLVVKPKLKPAIVKKPKEILIKKVMNTPAVKVTKALQNKTGAKAKKLNLPETDKAALKEQPTTVAVTSIQSASDDINNDIGNSPVESVVESIKTDKSISFVEANIRIKKMTPPKYPHYAILQRKSGTAIVAIELNEKGMVKTSKLHLSSAHSILDKAVLHAARKWRFFPPVPIGKVLVPVRFELECSNNACKPKLVQQG